MEMLLRIALSNAVGAAALALLAAAVSRIVRRPALSHLLWVIVLLKLIAPPLFSVPVHFGQAAPHVAAVPNPAPVELSPSVPTGTLAPPVVRHSVASYLPAALVLLWLSGAACFAAVAALRLVRFTRLLRFATPAPDEVQKQCRDLAARLGLRSGPPVALLRGNVCPMLWAPPLRPRLIIPSELWDRLSLRQRSTLMLHELAHLRRRDHLVRTLELIALTLFWWNPVAWWARHELRQAEEQCCDAWVTWALPAGNHDYASALVEAVEFASAPFLPSPAPLPALASGIGEFRHLKRRLVMIQQGNASRTLGKLGIALACAAAMLLPLTISRAQPPAEALPAARSAAAQRASDNRISPNDLLSITFSDMNGPNTETIKQARVSESGNISVPYLDQPIHAAGLTEIQLELAIIEAYHNANLIQNKASVTRVEAGQQGNAAAAPSATHAQVDRTLQSQLDRIVPQMDFNAVGLSDLVDFMRDVSGVRIVVDWEALKDAGIGRNAPVTIRLRNVKFSTAMTALLENVAKPGVLTWRPSGNLILITAAQPPHKPDTARANPNAIAVRVYDARDLIASGNGNSLILLITGSVAPDSWEVNGGKVGSIRLLTGQLIVRQTVANHRAIVNLLEHTRELMTKASRENNLSNSLLPGRSIRR